MSSLRSQPFRSTSAVSRRFRPFGVHPPLPVASSYIALELPTDYGVLHCADLSSFGWQPENLLYGKCLTVIGIRTESCGWSTDCVRLNVTLEEHFSEAVLCGEFSVIRTSYSPCAFISEAERVDHGPLQRVSLFGMQLPVLSLDSTVESQEISYVERLSNPGTRTARPAK